RPLRRGAQGRANASPSPLRGFCSQLPAGRVFVTTEGASQFGLRLLQYAPLARAQIVPGPVDVERQHRHRRAVWLALEAMAVLRRALERTRDSLRVVPREDAALEIERVALLRDTRRPAPTRR